MLVAIALEDDVAVVERRIGMMAIANGLAAAGVPHVVEMLQSWRAAPDLESNGRGRVDAEFRRIGSAISLGGHIRLRQHTPLLLT